jgi:hypothetical protein
MATNCRGVDVRSTISANEKHFTPKKVRAQAGTSPECQRHVMGRAAAGDPTPSRMIAATLLVYDTVAFREVTSRLHRAAVMIRQAAALVKRAVERQTAPARLADHLLTLDLVADQAKRLRKSLTEVETVEGTVGKTSDAKS